MNINFNEDIPVHPINNFWTIQLCDEWIQRVRIRCWSKLSEHLLNVTIVGISVTVTFASSFCWSNWTNSTKSISLSPPFDLLEWLCRRCCKLDTNTPKLHRLLCVHGCDTSSGSTDAHTGRLVVEHGHLEWLYHQCCCVNTNIPYCHHLSTCLWACDLFWLHWCIFWCIHLQFRYQVCGGSDPKW